MLEKTGFGAAHAVDGATEHCLDRCVGEVDVQGGLDRVDVRDVGFVGDHPATDAGVEFVEVLDYECAARIVAIWTNAVEGED